LTFAGQIIETGSTSYRLAFDAHLLSWEGEFYGEQVRPGDKGAETLRSWIRQQQVDDGRRDGVTSEAAAEIHALKRRNAELEQTIEILKAATSFFARESDPRSRR
jgi:transposase